MIALSMVLGILVAGLIWMTLIAFLQDRAPRDPAARRQGFTVLSLADAFDPDHASLWETQIPALQLISSSADGSVSTNKLFFCWGEARRRYPEIFENSSFTEWLSFLEDAHLIERDDDGVRITSDGRALLEYRLHAGEALTR